MLLLIDSDILIYQAIAAAEQELEFEEGMFILHTNMADAKDNFISQLKDVLDKAQEENYCLCLTDSKVNWRKEVYPLYKSNRKNTRKPLGFYQFRAWVEAEYAEHIFWRPTLEADDVIGILATKPNNRAVIWSKDKDLKQIPGLHLSTKDDGGPLLAEVSKEEGDYFHLRQTLTGDAVDGYPGCPGIGPVKADKVLQDKMGGHTSWERVVLTYAKAGLTEQDALAQAQVAKICQWQQWDGANQRVIHWTPTR